MLYSILKYFAKQYCLYRLKNLPHGSVTLYNNKNQIEIDIADIECAELHVIDDSVYMDVITYGELGLGRGYVNGKWASNDLEKLMTVLTRNAKHFNHELINSYNPFGFNVKKKTKDTDKKTIQQHYDYGNKFYTKFLDKEILAYSTGFWLNDSDNLETAIQNKVDYIIEHLGLIEGQNVLDIGVGWGGIANYITKKTKCHVTGNTISTEQAKYIMENYPDIKVMQKDYRDIIGQYDAIYSIEMLEHVGKYNYSQFLNIVSTSLKKNGKFVLQISISTQEGTNDINQSQFILTDIFPSGHIPRISWLLEALAQVDDLKLVHMQFFDGQHFAKTFREWNARMKENETEIDHKTLKAYEYYFNSCIGLYTNNLLASCVFVIQKI